jgi:hypothetical protein
LAPARVSQDRLYAEELIVVTWTVEQASKHFDVSERTIRHWCESGTLSAQRSGKRLWMITSLTKTSGPLPVGESTDDHRSETLEFEVGMLRSELRELTAVHQATLARITVLEALLDERATQLASTRAAMRVLMTDAKGDGE